MTDLFQKYLLTELHMVVYQPGNPADMTDLGLCEAVTLNENLHSLGFALKPEGIAQLAVSPTLYTFFDEVNALVPDIKVQPMYPGFPREVLEMDEAMLRFNQAMHYLSTYGVENFFGHQVSKGWLPKSDATLATRAPKRLLDLKCLDLVDEEKAAVTVLKTLFARRERLTWPELTMVLESIPCCTVEDVTEMHIRFKENVELLFPHILRMKDRKAALVGLRAICAHCGDVLRCAADYIRRQKYHLSTAEKKLFVRLLELYPVKNLRQNLIMSQRLRERNLIVLRVLDYNRFSKSEEHREVVRALRAGELLSWYGLSEKLLLEKAPNALYHLAGRPGVMLRMLNRLLELGYAPEEILEKLRPQAGFVSGQMVVKLVHEMASRETELRRKYQEDVEYWRKSFENERNTYTPESLKERYNCDVGYVKRDASWRCSRLEWEYLHEPIRRTNCYAEKWLRPFRKKCSYAEAQLLEVREILRRQESFEKETVHTLVSNAICECAEAICTFCGSAILQVPEQGLWSTSAQNPQGKGAFLPAGLSGCHPGRPAGEGRQLRFQGRCDSDFGEERPGKRYQLGGQQLFSGMLNAICLFPHPNLTRCSDGDFLRKWNSKQKQFVPERKEGKENES